MNIAVAIEPSPIEVDPRPCGLCGLTIDLHEMVDDGDGPIFFCDEFEREIFLRANHLVRQWEAVAVSTPPPRRPAPYRPPAPTIDAFWHVVRLDDADYLSRWLARHPDAPELLKIWKGKQC